MCQLDTNRINRHRGWLRFVGICLILVGVSSNTAVAFADPPVFEDATDTAGVAFTGAQFGASWGDYDGDGWVDLFANNHFQNSPNLYHNNGDGTFIDVFTSSGIKGENWDPHGPSWGDYDNDGDLDLYITHGRGRTYFYVNQGNGSFVEQADAAGVNDQNGRGRTANWIDYDHDGDLDLFKGNEIRETGPDKLYRNNGNGTFSDVSDAAGLHDTAGTWGNVWGDYDDDGDMDVVLTGGERVRLYRNNSDGTFTEVTSAANVTGWQSKCWGGDFGDYDNDGDLDLYVVCGNYKYFDHVEASNSAITYTFTTSDDHDGFDFQSSSNEVAFDPLQGGGSPMSVDQVYIGATNWHPFAIPFTLGATTDHCGQPSYTPESDTGVFIWQDCPAGTWHLRASDINMLQGQVRTDGTFTNVVSVEFEPFNPSAKINRLYQNQGDGTFQEVGEATGVNSDKTSYDATWLDYDNDGWLDLYVVNAGNVAIGNEANHLYHNNGDGTFTDVAEAVGVQAITPGHGSCATWADYDHNGFLDLFVITDGKSGYLGGPHKLYRNLGNGNHWLEINLVGTFSNRQGIGSKVIVSAGGITQIRQANNGSHYICQNSSTLHFGLGNATHADAITITWPSEQQQVLHNVLADQILQIIEGESITAGVTLIESDGSTDVAEGGATDTYTMILTSQPAANVTVMINPDTQITVTPTSLVFTPQNWDTPQTVTVTAMDDGVAEGPHTGIITHTATSTDSNYDDVTINSVTVNITDKPDESDDMFYLYLPVILRNTSSTP